MDYFLEKNIKKYNRVECQVNGEIFLAKPEPYYGYYGNKRKIFKIVERIYLSINVLFGKFFVVRFVESKNDAEDYKKNRQSIREWGFSNKPECKLVLDEKERMKSIVAEDWNEFKHLLLEWAEKGYVKIEPRDDITNNMIGFNMESVILKDNKWIKIDLEEIYGKKENIDNSEIVFIQRLFNSQKGREKFIEALLEKVFKDKTENGK